MDDLFMVLGSFALFIGLPVSVVWFIVRKIKRYSTKRQAILIVASIVVSFVFLGIGTELYSKTDEYQQQVKEEDIKEKTKKSQSNDNQSIKVKKESAKKPNEKTESSENLSMTSAKKSEENVKEREQVEQNSVVKKDSLTVEESEEEYKQKCKELWYDEIFFGKDDIEDKDIKINVYFEEKYYFTVEDMYNTDVQAMYDDNNLYRDYYKCGVLRQGTDSYVGEQIKVLFTQDYSLNPMDYEVECKAVLYGKIIYYGKNTWSGYNDVYIIPKYIDKLN